LYISILDFITKKKKTSKTETALPALWYHMVVSVELLGPSLHKVNC